jgi:hypothetical protein
MYNQWPRVRHKNQYKWISVLSPQSPTNTLSFAKVEDRYTVNRDGGDRYISTAIYFYESFTTQKVGNT